MAEVGSTAMTATRLAARAQELDQGRGERGLAAAGRPGDAEQVGVAGVRGERAQQGGGLRAAVLDAA